MARYPLTPEMTSADISAARMNGRDEVGAGAPLTMGDRADISYQAFDHNFHPNSRVDQAIIATRRAVFPELGLDPGIY